MTLLLGGFCNLTLLVGRSQDSTTFSELFDQYLHADADQAVLTFATWNRRRIEREARLPDETTDKWSLAALALFHTEAWLRALSRQSVSPADALAHNVAAVRLMSEQVCPTAAPHGETRLFVFCRDWYPVVLGQSQVLAEAKEFLPDDARIQLARGAWAEFLMGPAAEPGGATGYGFLLESVDGPYVTTSHGRFGRAAADAQSSLERALEIEPTLAEARLRLGRVRFLLDERETARREFQRAQTDAHEARDTFSEYLAAMFLGQLHEEAGQNEEALASYKRATEVGPRFPGAPVVLARLLAATGRPAEASQAIETFFDGLQPSGMTGIDPWTEYPRGRAYWHRGQILLALRQVVRR